MVIITCFKVKIVVFLIYHFFETCVPSAHKSICYSDFEENSKESAFVDKSLFIKDFLQDEGQKIVITAPRGFGKTANLHMLKSFLQLEMDKDGNRITKSRGLTEAIKDTPGYKLFQQLKIMDHPDVMTKYFGKYPVIHVDLKSVVRFFYFNETQDFFREVQHETYLEHCYLQHSKNLYEEEKEFVKLWCSDKYVEEDMGSLMPGIERLSKYLYKHFDRSKVIVLVDHYDCTIQSCLVDPDTPDVVFKYVINIIQMLFNIKKDDFYVSTFFITGISQIEESHYSNDNIIKRYQFLNENRFVPYYGLLEDELFDVLGRNSIDVDNNLFEAVQNNYGGYVSITNLTIHNVWAVRQYLQRKVLDHVWAKTSEIPNLHLLFKIPDIQKKITMLLKGTPVVMELKKSFSFETLLILKDLFVDPAGKAHLLYTTLFYSSLFEHGFFAYDPRVKSAISDARRYVIPNEEVKQFLWKTVND